MVNKVLFRTAFQGFKKEDVVAYIDKMSKDTKMMLDEKEGEVNRIRAIAEEKDGEIAALNEKCARLEAQLAEAAQKDSEIASLKEQLDEKEFELARAMQRTEMPEGAVTAEVFGALEREYNHAITLNNALEKQLEVYREFDGVQKDLGTIIIKAEKNASEFIAKAKREAQDMVDAANAEAREAIDRKIRICKDLTDRFENSRADMENAHRTVCEKLESMRNSADVFYDALQQSNVKIHEAMADAISAADGFSVIAEENK